MKQAGRYADVRASAESQPVKKGVIQLPIDINEGKKVLIKIPSRISDDE